MSRRSEHMRTTSAVLIATSVPAPTAIPTSACAKAGASATPSATSPVGCTNSPRLRDLVDLQRDLQFSDEGLGPPKQRHAGSAACPARRVRRTSRARPSRGDEFREGVAYTNARYVGCLDLQGDQVCARHEPTDVGEAAA